MQLDENVSTSNVCRRFVKQHSSLLILGSVCILGFSAATCTRTAKRAAPTIEKNYYYDMATDRIFTSDTSEPSPIAAPWARRTDPPTGVAAIVFSCGDCADARSREIHWVEAHSPEVKESERMRRQENALENAPAPMMALYNPSDPDWKKKFVSFSSPEAADIRRAHSQRCGNGKKPVHCRPSGE